MGSAADQCKVLHPATKLVAAQPEKKERHRCDEQDDIEHRDHRQMVKRRNQQNEETDGQMQQNSVPFTVQILKRQLQPFE